MKTFEYMLSSPFPNILESAYSVTFDDYINSYGKFFDLSDFSLDKILVDNVDFDRRLRQDYFIVKSDDLSQANALMNVVNNNFKNYLKSRIKNKSYDSDSELFNKNTSSKFKDDTIFGINYVINNSQKVNSIDHSVHFDEHSDFYEAVLNCRKK